ncbi:MAG: hypothetical protein RL757_1866 [Bacteroidota bacterium]|jgi:hypothetical protein
MPPTPKGGAFILGGGIFFECGDKIERKKSLRKIKMTKSRIVRTNTIRQAAHQKSEP